MTDVWDQPHKIGPQFRLGKQHHYLRRTKNLSHASQGFPSWKGWEDLRLKTTVFSCLLDIMTLREKILSVIKTMIVWFDTNWTNASDERRQEMRNTSKTFIEFPTVLATVGYLIGGWTFAFYFFILPYAGLAVWWLKAEIGNLLDKLWSRLMGYYAQTVVWAKA